MKVALYYPWIYLTSGAERTILELTGQSRHEWTIYTGRYEPANTFPGFVEREVRELGHVTVRRTVLATGMNCLRILKQRLPVKNHDVLLVVSEGLGDLIVFRNSCRPIICVCLTPLRIAFDPIYRMRYLQERGVLARTAITIGGRVFRGIDRLAWNRYARVFCISQEAKKRAVEGKLAKPDRIEVIHPGLGFRPKKPSERFEQFFLIPGRIMWTKNIELGIEAFLRFRAFNPSYQHFRLIIAGIVDRKSEGYLEKLRKLAGTGSGIEIKVFPSDAELSELYATCYATLFTAFNEDWGIVPIESLSFGKPVIAVNRGGPGESIVHGVHGFLEEADPAAFAERMAEFATNPDLVARMGENGWQHSHQFTWDGFTSRIDKEIDNLGPSRGVNSLGKIRQPHRVSQPSPLSTCIPGETKK